MTAHAAPPHFPSHPRFAYRAVLGRGGMGVVYRVYDGEIDLDVALKTVDDAERARLLKREFRAVADVSHPNLVEIYELFAEQEQSFFTMELLDGVDFVRFVRGGTIDATAGRLADDALGRALDALEQLVEGVAAIHDAGMLHRDIKASNVMVCPLEAGDRHRVVLLDFGLATSASPRADARSQFAGTPMSMPPEQLWGRPLTAASDWYGVGALLYEALTGRPPDLRAHLFGAGAKPIEPPGARTAGIPAWLDALAVELLTPEPGARPAEAEIRQRIARGRTLAPRLDAAQRRADGTQGSHRPLASEDVFVGRQNELGRLTAAFAEVRGGATAVVLVSGVSGIGKTELLRHFTGRLRADGAVALCGRCHPRESVPFAGFDQIVDDLVEHLAELDRGDDDLVPEHASQLLRLFPAFAAAPGFARIVADHGATEPQVLRHLAAGALREILIRLAARQPLVLWIDDLQWTNEDSSFLLRSILRPPVPGRVAVLLSYRSEEHGDNDVLRDVVRFVSEAPGLRVTAIEPRALAPEESAQLVAELFDRAGAESGALHAAIARESEGSPFFIGELVRHHAQARARRDQAAATLPIHIQDVVARRFDGLRAIEQRLLEAVAVAGAPIARDVALRAIGLGAAGRAVAGALEKQCLLKSSIAGGLRRVRPYHDRIGESVLERLSATNRLACHRNLATALEREPDVDPEALVTHWLGADEPRRAGDHAVAAADRAARALAFRRAADLYAIAIEHAPPERDRHPLRVALAEALASSGRGAQAASRFEEAARHLAADGGDELAVIALRRRAAEQFLCCGLIDEGLGIMRDVAPRLGLAMPRTPAAAVRSFLWQRLRLRVRGLDFRRRDAAGIAAETLERMDAMFGTAKGVSMVTPTVAATLHAQHLLMALDLGEPSRVAQALTNEAAFCAIIGGKRYWRRAADVLQRTAKLAAEASQPYDIAFYRMGAGAVAWSRGDWDAAIAHSATAVDVYKRRCRGVAFEIAITNVFFLSALALAGRIAELTERTHAELQDARERGDLFGISACIMPEPVLVWLAADRAESALQQADETIARWPTDATLTQHYHHVIATGELLLYLGRPWEAWRRIVGAWPQLKRARYLSLTCPCHLLLFLRASVAIAAAAAPRDADVPGWTPARLLRLARRDARRLGRGPLPFAAPCAETLRAALAGRRGQTSQAARLLESAIAGFDRAGMPVHREAARLRLGTLVKNGEEHAARARRWMTTAGIQRPDALAAVFAAG